MATNLSNQKFLLNYESRSRRKAENEQLESIKSITNLLLRKIEALENDASTISGAALMKNSNLHEVISAFEKKLIRDALRATNWNQKRAAQLLGVKVTTLNAKIKRHEINIKSFADL